MYFKQDLYNKIILYIGDVEQEKSYFPIKEVKINNYPMKEIHDYLALMIEGKIIHGIFADSEESENYGYLIGGLTTESRYYYNMLKKGQKAMS